MLIIGFWMKNRRIYKAYLNTSIKWISVYEAGSERLIYTKYNLTNTEIIQYKNRIKKL